MQARGSIYGTRDAGRNWWKHLNQTLLDAGWVRSALEPALFYYRNPDGTLAGAIVSHVDDLVVTGGGEEFEKAFDIIKKKLKLKVTENNFVFCAKTVSRDDEGSFYVSQKEAAQNIEKIDVEKKRRSDPTSVLTEAELSELRRVIGSVGWVARQTRADLLCGVSLLAQSTSRPTVEELIDANKLVEACREDAEFKLKLTSDSKLSLEDCDIVVSCDAAFANADDARLGKKTKSQCGYHIGLAPRGAVDGEDPFIINTLEVFSGTIKRVCRSTLAAEVNGVLEAVEAAIWIRAVMAEIVGKEFTIRNADAFSDGNGKTIRVLTDAKSLKDTVDRDGTGIPSDRRLRILLAQLKQSMECDNVAVDWVDTLAMLADSLTKVGTERGFLLNVLQGGTYSPRQTELMAARKAEIREGRHRRAALRRAALQPAEPPHGLSASVGESPNGLSASG